jgi:hypothetical protein
MASVGETMAGTAAGSTASTDDAVSAAKTHKEVVINFILLLRDA